MDYNGYVIERVTAAVLDEKRREAERQALLATFRRGRGLREVIGGGLVKLGRFIERGTVPRKALPSAP